MHQWRAATCRFKRMGPCPIGSPLRTWMVHDLPMQKGGRIFKAYQATNHTPRKTVVYLKFKYE
jgi:hypothetical protein